MSMVSEKKKGIKEAHMGYIKSEKVIVTEDEVRGLRGVSKSLVKERVSF